MTADQSDSTVGTGASDASIAASDGVTVASGAGTARHGAGEGEPFLAVRDLRTYYEDRSLLASDPPVKAVDGVSFDLRRGETLGLVGESGCGKTTLGRTLVGLESATGGTVTVDGEDVTALGGSEKRAWQRRLGMVFQDPQESLNDRQTVGETIAEPLAAHGWPFLTVSVTGVAAADLRGDAVSPVGSDDGPADLTVDLGGGEPSVSVRAALPLEAADVSVQVDRGGPGGGRDIGVGRPVVTVTVGKSRAEMRRERAFALLERVGLREEHYYRYPHQFSGGQRQRVGIARALALEPEFLVLDEPVSALDVSVQARIINLLADLQDALGLTYLFIAHDLSVVRHIADRVAVMYLGNLVEVGPAESVYTDPAHPYTLSLLSAIPGSGSPWTGERVRLRGTPPSPRDPPAGCPFTTRCPAKIRPDGWELPEATWRALDELAAVFRTRARDETALSARLRRLLGLSVDADAVDAAVADLLDGRSLPADAHAVVDEAADLAKRGRDDAAAVRLVEAFGSRCDAEHPDPVDRGTGWRSRCLRHDGEHRDAAETVAARQRERER